MKRKNLFITLLTICTTTFSIYSMEEYHKNSQKEISPHLDYEKISPLQFSIYNIKHYFSNLHSTFPSIEGEKTPMKIKSKTSIFNQSLTHYIKEMYNHKYYANFLSQDGSHIVNFLELGNEFNLEIESLYTCIRLFYNKIKSCELIDDTVLLQILQPMPTLLEKFFNCPECEVPTLNTLANQTENILLYQFTQNMPQFQEEPNIFLSQLSEQVAKIAKKELDSAQKTLEQKEMLERLRQIIIRFLEISLSKVIWNQTHYEGIWESVLTMSNGLKLLGINSILDHMDDLDDLLWSLTHRFCFFLNLAGSYLPVSFYEEIEYDIASKVVFFLEMSEQDDEIKTKKETLIESLLKAKAKAIAFEKKGIFTDQII